MTPTGAVFGTSSTPGMTPATVAVAEKGLSLYVPPESDTRTVGVAWVIVNVNGAL